MLGFVPQPNLPDQRSHWRKMDVPIGLWSSRCRRVWGWCPCIDDRWSGSGRGLRAMISSMVLLPVRSGRSVCRWWVGIYRSLAVWTWTSILTIPPSTVLTCNFCNIDCAVLPIPDHRSSVKIKQGFAAITQGRQIGNSPRQTKTNDNFRWQRQKSIKSGVDNCIDEFSLPSWVTNHKEWSCSGFTDLTG